MRTITAKDASWTKVYDRIEKLEKRIELIEKELAKHGNCEFESTKSESREIGQ